jgi:hypothetical protein
MSGHGIGWTVGRGFAATRLITYRKLPASWPPAVS